jgi:hypothetical protein
MARASHRGRAARLAAVVLALGAAASASAGCRSTVTSSRLDLTVDADAALALDQVQITVGGGGRSELMRGLAVSAPSGTPAAVPPVVWQIVIPNVGTTFVATIDVRGMKGGAELVRLDADATIAPDSRVAATLVLGNACKQMICNDPGQTCLDGSCQARPTFGGAPEAGADAAPSADAAADHGPDGGAAGSGGGDAGGPAVNGAPCSRGTDCTSGNCVENVCCDKTCTDLCNSCRSALTASLPDGTCGLIAPGKDDPQARCGAATAMASCGNTGHCDGKGACEKYGSTTICLAAACASGSYTPASTCDSNGNCVPGNAQNCMGFTCSPASGCAITCNGDADCTGGYCSANKTCVAKQIDGSTCTGNNQCANNHCVGGICCESACTGLCQSCANADTGQSSGLCRPVKAGGSSNGGCAADSTTCGHDGTCDGSGGCRFHVSSTPCRAASCTGGAQTNAVNCDGLGNCPNPATSPCAPYVCGTTACTFSCTNNSQCAVGAACVGGTSCQTCATGTTVCPNACVNLTNNSSNCGACGHSCQGGTCSNGTCQPITLATLSTPRTPVALALNSSTVFFEIPGNSVVAWSLYAVPKTAANITPTPILTQTAANNLGGYLAASDTLLVTQYGFNNPGGSTLTTFSCTPTSCSSTKQNWFTDTQAPTVCDLAVQECFTELGSQFTIQHATFGTPSQTTPADYNPLLNSNGNSVQWAAGGFLYIANTPAGASTSSILERMPEDGTGRLATLANVGAGNFLGVASLTSSQVFLVASLDNFATTGMMSVPLPNGLSGTPSYLAGTSLAGNGWIAGWGDDAGIYFGTAAAQWVTCPASGCTGAPKVVGDASHSAPLLVGDAQSVYWVNFTQDPNTLATTGVSLMKLPR